MELPNRVIADAVKAGQLSSRECEQRWNGNKRSCLHRAATRTVTICICVIKQITTMSRRASVSRVRKFHHEFLTDRRYSNYRQKSPWGAIIPIKKENLTLGR